MALPVFTFFFFLFLLVNPVMLYLCSLKREQVKAWGAMCGLLRKSGEANTKEVVTKENKIQKKVQCSGGGHYFAVTFFSHFAVLYSFWLLPIILP